MDLVTIFE